MFLVWEALGSKPVPVAHALPRSNFCLGCFMGKTSEGHQGLFRSSLGGAIGDTLALGARMLLPVDPKPPPVLYLVCQVKTLSCAGAAV